MTTIIVAVIVVGLTQLFRNRNLFCEFCGGYGGDRDAQFECDMCKGSGWNN